jgi:cytochrome c oxidase assembly protein Cox11
VRDADGHSTGKAGEQRDTRKMFSQRRQSVMEWEFWSAQRQIDKRVGAIERRETVIAARVLHRRPLEARGHYMVGPQAVAVEHEDEAHRLRAIRLRFGTRD